MSSGGASSSSMTRRGVTAYLSTRRMGLYWSLDLRRPQSPASSARAPHGGGEGLGDGGVDAFVADEGLFDVDDEGVADDLADGDGGDLAVDLHEAADLGEVVEHGEEGLGGVELLLGEEGILGVLARGVLAEEVVDSGDVGGGHGAVEGLGVGAAELGDVVALAGEAAAGVVDEVGEVVEVVAPGAGVGDGHVAAVAAGEEGEALGGDGAEDEGDALGDAPGLDGGEGAELGVLVGVGVDGVGEAGLAAVGGAEDEAALGLGVGGVGVGAPHQEEAEGVVGHAEGVALHVAAEGGEFIGVQGAEVHRVLLSVRPTSASGCGPRWPDRRGGG